MSITESKREKIGIMAGLKIKDVKIVKESK
jgi:hypothetical protein